jgi:hypothetical protein
MFHKESPTLNYSKYWAVFENLSFAQIFDENMRTSAAPESLAAEQWRPASFRQKSGGLGFSNTAYLTAE